MSLTPCPAPLVADALVAYWLGECSPDEEARIEEHFLGCGTCSERLQELVALRDGVRRLARRGGMQVIVPEAFVRRMAELGMRVREYRVPCNGAVNCTVTPDDDLLVARLAAPLDDVQRLDLVQHLEGHGHARFEDVPFDAAAGAIVVAVDMPELRKLPASRTRMQLIAVDSAGRERVLGDYTFNHTPYAEPR